MTMTFRLLALFSALLVLAWPAGPAAAQGVPPMENGLPAQQGVAVQPGAPAPLTVRSVTVEGVEGDNMRGFVLRTSGLEEGQQITLPGSEDLAEAIRSLYETRVFSDVQVTRRSAADGAVDLTIHVTPEPRLIDYTFHGVKRSHRDDLEERVPLLKGRPVRPSDVERAKQSVRAFYREKGFLTTSVDVDRTVNSVGQVALDFYVDRGERVEVDEIDFAGNEVFSDRRLRRRLDETKENRWWRFWKRETFDDDEFETDKQAVIDYYREKGYYDARIVSDSVYLSGRDDLRVELRVEEGQQYHIRDITWEGNTVYPDQVLTSALGFEQGDTYNETKLQENLSGNRRSSDVASLYLNRGYLRFDAQPTVRVVGGDSLDLAFDIREGDVYDIGAIDIAGNDKTKDYVIRRELYTVPGQTFSRDAIQESIRRLMQLKYFSQESLAGGPAIDVNDETKQVDLTYSVEEVGSDQLELSGTYGGYGIVLQLRFTFNNFSIQNIFNPEAYRPLPTGDGQQLSLAIQTNGTYYQNYSVSFTEPWFRGRPTPIGGSVSFSRYTDFPYRSFYNTRRSDGSFTRISSRLFYQRRLKWPDDKFMTSSAVSYSYYLNDNFYDENSFSRIPEGASHEVVLEQGVSRNSLDNPLFPSNGSKASLTLEVAPPINRVFGTQAGENSRFVQYHKWRFKTNWNLPLVEKLTLSLNSDYGYIGSLTGEDVQFQRFVVGGSPFDYTRFNFGVDPVFMRGYPAQVIGPRARNAEGDLSVVLGGRILNKYTSELRWMAVQSQQLQAAPYLYLDASNTWRSFDTYNPASLYRSAGVGLRLFLPIVGMLEVNYGYNFDEYLPFQGEDGLRGWTFQFSLGQGFNE